MEDEFTNLPKTREEVAERQHEMDIIMLTNTLDWIKELREIPVEQLDEDDVFTIQQTSYYIDEMYEHDDVRSANKKKYPEIEKSMRDYIRGQADHHRIYLLRLAAKKKRVKVAKASTFIVGLLTVVMFFAQGVSTYAFGYDLLGGMADWGKSVLGISKDSVLTQDNVTLVKNGQPVIYDDVEDAVKALGVNILYPTYLPDGINVTQIIYTEEDDTAYFKCDNKNLTIRIELSVDRENDFTENIRIGDYFCNAVTNDTYCEIFFIDNTNAYVVKYTDYNIASKIVENLKYVQ